MVDVFFRATFVANYNNINIKNIIIIKLLKLFNRNNNHQSLLIKHTDPTTDNRDVIKI